MKKSEWKEIALRYKDQLIKIGDENQSLLHKVIQLQKALKDAEDQVRDVGNENLTLKNQLAEAEKAVDGLAWMDRNRTPIFCDTVRPDIDRLKYVDQELTKFMQAVKHFF